MAETEALSTYYILFVGTVGMFILACAAIFFFVSYYRRNLRAHRELHELEIDHQQKLIFSNLQTLEDERKRFAEDLHDEIGASLSAIRMNLSRMELTENDQQVKEQFREVKSIVDQSMQSARRISHNMLPPGLTLFGLVQVVEELSRQLSSDSFEVSINAPEMLPRLDNNAELALYRILQELLNNTMKHAGASRVQIDFNTTDNNIYTVRYSDNGKGFNPDDVRYAGLGLRNTENRVKMIGGAYHFTSAPGKGLQVEIEIPLK